MKDDNLELSPQHLQELMISLFLSMQKELDINTITEIMTSLDSDETVQANLDEVQQDQYGQLHSYYQKVNESLTGDSNVYFDYDLLDLTEGKLLLDNQRSLLLDAMLNHPFDIENSKEESLPTISIAAASSIEKCLKTLSNFVNEAMAKAEYYSALNILLNMSNPAVSLKLELDKLDISEQVKKGLQEIKDFYWYINTLNTNEISETEAVALQYLNLQRNQLTQVLARIYFSNINQEVNMLPFNTELTLKMLKNYFSPKVTFQSAPMEYEGMVQRVQRRDSSETVHRDRFLIFKGIALNDISLLIKAHTNVELIDTDIKDGEDLTPLMVAAKLGSFQATHFLVAQNFANIDETHSETGMQPVHFAALGRHEYLVAYFIRNGADTTIKAVLEDKPTTLKEFLEVREQLCEAAKVGISDLLLDTAGAYLLTMNEPESAAILKAALETAVANKQTEALFLLVNCLEVNLVNNPELAKSCLYLAAINNDSNMVENLFELSQLELKRDEFSQTLIDIARSFDNNDLVKMIEDKMPSLISSYASSSVFATGSLLPDSAQTLVADVATDLRSMFGSK